MSLFTTEQPADMAKIESASPNKTADDSVIFKLKIGRNVPTILIGGAIVGVFGLGGYFLCKLLKA